MWAVSELSIVCWVRIAAIHDSEITQNIVLAHYNGHGQIECQVATIGCILKAVKYKRLVKACILPKSVQDSLPI